MTVTLKPSQISHSIFISFRDEFEAGRDYDPPDVTLSADLFATEATLVVQRTKTPIESVEGGYHVTAQVVVEDPVHGALGVTTVLGQLLTYVPKVLDHVLDIRRVAKE